jgi:hypothetical protein
MQLPPYRWRLAHLAALWAYGVSQPVFAMLKSNPEFLVVRASTRSDVVIFTLLVTLGVPLIVLGAERLAALFNSAIGNTLHVLAIWGLAFVAGLQVLRLLHPDRSLTLLLPLTIAVVATVLYLRTTAFRAFLSISVALPIVAALGFLATIPLATDDRQAVNVQVERPVPIVLVVLDEFPLSSILRADGSIDTVRYPGFGELSRTSTWYRGATTVHDFTMQAVPAILTGLLPRPHALPTLADHPDNLFTLLGERYAIHAEEQVTVLCPSRYCPLARRQVPVADRLRGLLYDTSVGYLHSVLPRSLQAAVPAIGERWNGFGDPAQIPVKQRVLGARDFKTWLRAGKALEGNDRVFARFMTDLSRPSRQPPLYFVHLLLPHAPWTRLPSGGSYNGVVKVEGLRDDWSRWRSNRLLVAEGLEQHLLQVGYTDRLVGLLLQTLRRTGLLDRALLVVAADHGASFYPGLPPRLVDRDNLPDIAGVPLFVKYPGQRTGTVDERDAKTIDIVPTIAEVLGVHIPWHVDGRPLRARPVEREVSVFTTDRDPVSADPEVIRNGVLSTARRNAALFGAGHDSLFRLGPFEELLGRKVESLSTAVSAGDAVRLDDAGAFAHVEFTGVVPVRVSGQVTGASVRPETALAVAVNGRVEATTRAFALGGRTEFVTLVPEQSFRTGPNTVAVYSVARTTTGLHLTLLGGTPADAVRRVAASAVGPRP